ncbi:MAG: hypothetical protein QM581_03020 [Pseudomonas sp.]
MFFLVFEKFQILDMTGPLAAFEIANFHLKREKYNLLGRARLLVRSYDREHSLRLIHAGVDYQLRETFESAIEFGRAALVELGVDADEAAGIAREICKRDAERAELEIAGGGLKAGVSMLYGNQSGPKPTPFTTPRRESRTLSPDIPVA